MVIALMHLVHHQVEVSTGLNWCTQVPNGRTFLGLTRENLLEVIN